LTGNGSYKFYSKPKLRSCYLLVCWNEDAGRLGASVTDYINEQLKGQLFCEIEPEGFFYLGGVLVEGNIAQFPESRFYCCPEKNLIIFKSNSPRSEWYKFLNMVLDITEDVCPIRELYTIGGMVALAAHTTPRQLLATANSPEMKTVLSQYDLAGDMDYETPPGQRPTLSSYLLWLAKGRNIMGTALWMPVPFYLVSIGDPRACKKTVDFFNKRFELDIDLSVFDEEIHRQNEKIARLANRFLELDDFLHKLEANVSLTDEESSRLVQLMEEHLDKENQS
jgi:proteasome assembly chaperone (PAC2) family protein